MSEPDASDWAKKGILKSAQVTKRRLHGFLMVFLTIGFCLGACELVFRFFVFTPMFYGIDVLSYGGHYTLSPNPGLIYTPKPNTGKFNAYGHRGKAYPFEKNEKTRIVFMGDSVVEGTDVIYKYRFTELLEAKTGLSHECVNLGVRGYNFAQEFAYFKELGIRFSPDFVFWCITHNDLDTASGELENLSGRIDKIKKNSFYMHYYGLKGRVQRVLLHSRAFCFLRYFFSSHSTQKFEDALGHQLNEEHLNSIFTSLKSMETKHGFKTLFIFLPINTNDNQDAMKNMKNFARKAGFPCYDIDSYINSAMNPEEKKSLFFKNDTCHLNPLGHTMAAQFLSPLFPDPRFDEGGQ